MNKFNPGDLVKIRDGLSEIFGGHLFDNWVGVVDTPRLRMDPKRSFYVKEIPREAMVYGYSAMYEFPKKYFTSFKKEQLIFVDKEYEDIYV